VQNFTHVKTGSDWPVMSAMEKLEKFREFPHRWLLDRRRPHSCQSVADMSVLVGIAGAILIALILAPYFIGKCFHDRKTRMRIMVGTVVAYSLICVAYFGFIAFVLSGDINR
jgi:hypothetical protein